MTFHSNKWVESPLVSIIVNCYNGEKFLSDAIKSALSQTYKNWELIFWDNQSKDSSKEIFNSFKDERLKYFYANKHTVLYEARNHALEKISGNFIAFLDVDDFWEKNKLEEQIKEFKDHNVSLVYSNFWFTNETKTSKRLAFKFELPSGAISNEIIRDYPVGMLTILIRRESLNNLDYIFDSRFQMIGDFDLVIRLSLDHKIVGLNKPMASYRLHDSNMSKHYRKLQNFEIEQWLNENEENPKISKLKGFSYRKKLLFYYKGIEASQNFKPLEAIKYIKNIPIKLQVRLFLYIIAPKKLLKIIGRY